MVPKTYEDYVFLGVPQEYIKGYSLQSTAGYGYFAHLENLLAAMLMDERPYVHSLHF